MTTDIFEIINDAQNYADTAFNETLSLISKATTAANSRTNILERDLLFSPTVKDQVVAGEFGDFTDSYVAPTNNATVPVFETLYVPNIPTEWGNKPDPLDTSDLFQQDVPVYNVQPLAADAPEVDTNFETPDAPVINLPDAPELGSITVNDAPQVTVPTFDKDFIFGDPTAIDDVAARFEAEYENALPVMKDYIDSAVEEWVNKYSPNYYDGLAQLEAKLASDMPGGQALSDEVEQAIYDRARARTEAERAAEEAKLTDAMGKRGFDLPPGAVAGGLQQIAASSARNNAMQAAETAIERAKIEVQHVQFVMQQANFLRQFMQNLAMQRAQQMGSVNGQAIQYASQLADILLQVYQSYLRQYEAALAYYRTEAEVFEVRIKSALAELEAYRIEVEGKKLQGDLQKQEIELFSEQINAEQAKIQLYLGELQGITTEAELERTKVQVFGEQVNAYVGEVRAKTAEFAAYQAAISGDEAKVNAYVQQVNAYRAEVDAARAQLGGEVAYSESIASYNRNLSEQFRTEVAAYTTEVQAESTRFNASSDAYRTGLEAYRTQLSAQIDVLRSQIDEDRINLESAVAKFQGDIDIATKNADVFMKHVDILSSTASNSARTAGTIASSALDSNNTMVTQVNSGA